ncbi:MAG: 5,10-methylene tetrahydromethanopterin reductase, partial [Gluconobacter potus]
RWAEPIQVVNPDSYNDFIRLVLPELKRRGRIKPKPGKTLRESLFPQNTSAHPAADHPAWRC